jgi:hypothetical protein
MTVNVLAGQIANTAIYALKDRVPQISQLSILEQEDIRDTIRNAALDVLARTARSYSRS